MNLPLWVYFNFNLYRAMDFLKFFPPLHKESTPFVIIAAAASLVLGSIWDSLGWLGLIITLWVMYFFRDPYRYVPDKKGLVVSPADGVISKIEEAPLPGEFGSGEKEYVRVSIFLNIFDVHVNRVPIAGVVTKLHYNPGKFLNASLDKASLDNERQSIAVKTEEGIEIIFVQIAGLIARRIVCDLHENQEVKTGEKFGIIRFGSRVDVYLPEGINPLVVEGQRMIGGETVIADLTRQEAARIGVKR